MMTSLGVFLEEMASLFFGGGNRIGSGLFWVFFF